MTHEEAILYFSDSVIKALNENGVKPTADNIGCGIIAICFVVDRPDVKPEAASIHYADGKWVLNPEQLVTERC